MAKNDYLAKQRAIQRGFFEAGLQSGRQQIIDMLSLVLHDPQYMKKDTFGQERLLIVIKGIGEYIDKFQPAWERTEETDYYRMKMDDALGEIFGKGMHDTFLERYEYLPDYNYNTGKWK